MSKKVAISYQEIFKSLKLYFENKDIELEYLETEILKLNYNNYDLAIFYDEYDFTQKTNSVINIQPSLLPAFPNKNAIIQAFNNGVKVSGVTIHSKDKIIAQYPVLIGIDTHIDEFINEMLEVEKKLVPAVIDSLLNDRIFDFRDLFSHSCHKNGCSGCNGCH